MAVIVETIDQVWLRISSSGSEQGESATSFREIYEQAVDNEETMYMQLEGGVDIENLGDNVPLLVKYPAEVWFGSVDKYEADRVYDDVIVEVMPPEELWNPKRGFPEGYAVPILNIELKDAEDNVMVLEPGDILDYSYEEEQQYDDEYQEWYVTYRVRTSE